MKRESSILGIVLLVALVIGVIGARLFFLAERNRCGQRLAFVGASIHITAARIPDSFAEVETMTGPLPEYRMVTGHFPEPRPYLCDVQPHRFVGGYHVLYTDGSVRVLARPPDR